MIVNRVHEFNSKTEEEFKEIQNNLINKIELKNNFNYDNIKYCAGVDLAYFEKNNKNYGVCSIVIIDMKTKEVLQSISYYDEIKTPYIPGFLAFRELPLVIKAVEKLTIEPDLFIFDGNGYLHFNNMGIATHASFFLNKPTIGVAKSYLKIKNTDFIMPENEIGKFSEIIIDNKNYGRVLRTRKDVKPIFISCGNYIDIETTTKIILNLINEESRIPIPTRLADLETHTMRTQLKNTL